MGEPVRSGQFDVPTYYSRRNGGDRDFFMPVMAMSLLLFGAGGYYLHTHNPPPVTIADRISRLQQTRFIIEERKVEPKIEKPKPPAEKKEEAVKEEPIDLTKKPLLNREKDEIVETPPQEQVKRPPRRVYGLKKVYSTGIGASGSAADAIIGKRGNTLDTDIDTITATESDLKSVPVSITTVTTQPRIKSQVKPEYTKEMLENRIEGIIRVKMLIDIDGKVKRVVVLDDLGFGSKEKVSEACFKMVFEPARRGDKPVSVWIPFKFRFEMLDG
ncbi:MAG: energy transducer TonB [Chitinispirillaceae bacterium]|nr:energy transducer TonB [Chitinispirillaceae bacterium]